MSSSKSREANRFDVDQPRPPRQDCPEVVGSCSDVYGVISDRGIDDDVLSAGAPDRTARSAETTFSPLSGSGLFVTPIPATAKSDPRENDAITSNGDSAAPKSNVKSERLDYSYDTDDYSRFSQSDASLEGIDDVMSTDVKSENDDVARRSKVDAFTSSVPKVKKECLDCSDTDDCSRFSQIDTPDNSINPYKEETDEDSRFSAQDDKAPDTDEDSRFSDRSKFDSPDRSNSNNSRWVKKEPTDSDGDDRFSDASDHPGRPKSDKSDDVDESKVDPPTKEEPTFQELQKREAKNCRRYGDRVLLARQAATRDDDGNLIKMGMMKLGGGNQSSELYPLDPAKRMGRMGGRYCMAFNCRWNFGAPKYAGQPSGHVTHFPKGDGYDPEVTPFSAFVQRVVGNATLGWEYCGEYILLDRMAGTIRAHCVSQETKKCVLNDIKKSLSRPAGEWKNIIEYEREDIMSMCERDPSPPGPAWLVRFANDEPEPEDEGKEREERLDKESREKATNAAKARALGLNRDKEDLSDVDFAKKLVHYDDFYSSYAIKFVRYDEEMYDFVKDGMTTKNKRNKKRGEGEPCAKASDWYNIMDQQLEGDDRNSTKPRKRKR